MLFVNKLKVLTLMTCLVLVGQAFAAWDGTSTEQPQNTEVIDGKTFYLIKNEAQLAWFAAQVNATTKSNANPKSNINAILMADMDLGGHLWTPIAAGKGDTKFSGTIDGKNHKISGLYINGAELAAIHNNAYCNEPRGNQAATPTCNAQNLGFIGTLGHPKADQPGGTVKNIIFEKVNIQASTNAGDILTSKDSQISVGVVVGWMAENNQNVVDNCIAASGTIRTTGTGQGVGGIVGNAKKGTISNCMSLVEIHTSGAKADVGGIIGITKTNVTVSSCVYAGPGLENTGSNGSVGGVVGNVFSGTATAQNSYFEGNLTYNGNAVGGVGKDCGSKCSVTNTSEQAEVTNIDDIACALNGKNADNTCKEEPWSVGLTGLSLNGYGADGYKIIFNANGGNFDGSAVTKNIYRASGMTISDVEVGKPSREGYSFEGWAASADAEEPLVDLGTVSKSTKFYAVWESLKTITFNVAPGSFPSGEQSKTKKVANGEVITVEGLGDLPMFYCEEDGKTEENCDVGHYFTGWQLGGVNVELETLTATGDLVLNAVWETVKTYTVTYNANEHGVTTVSFVRVGEGEKVQSPTDPIAAEGYTFAGWYTEPECLKAFTFNEEIDHSYTLYAKWLPETFSITYEMNGVSSAGENPVSYTIETQTFALTAPADVAGYVFEGWFYDANFTQPASQVILGSTGDKTFYAKWTKKTYRIMYLADNNSQGAITDQFKEHGTPITLESAGYFNRKGYAQTGWATVAEGEKVYELGATYEENAALTLYPTWDTAHYVITYECNDCENSPLNPTTYTMFEKKDLPLKYPQNLEGYDFGGWFKEDTYETKTTQIKKGSWGDLTLYGKWIKVYSLSYELNGGTNANSRTSYTSETETFALGEAEGRDGYSFVGWFDNEELSGIAVTEIPQGSTGDKKFFAKWIPNTYTATYNLNGGSMEGEESFTFTIESGDVALATPTKNGYTFVGWLDDVTSAVVTVLSTGSFGDRTLTAQWSDPIEYTITYENVNGAANENATSYTIEQTVPLNALEKDGFAFRGWFTNAQFEGNAATEISAGASGDTTFYAKWLEIFTITYAAGEGDGITGAVAAGTKTATEDATLSNDGFTREGYTQTGWKTEDGSVTYAMGATYTTDASVTLYPIWEVETYNIVYHNIEGATFVTANPETYTVETLPIVLNNPAKEGYNFEGWFTDESFTGNPITGIETRLSNGNGDLYAKWSKVYPFLVNDFGAIKVYENSDGSKTAQINTNSSETVEIPSDISVNHVEFVRKFTVGKNSTIMLPFSIDTTKISGGSFKEFAYVDESVPKAVFYNDVAGGVVQANTPYIFVPTSDTLIFKLEEGETVSLNTNDIVVPVSNTDGGKWQFRGVYSREEWESGNRQVWGYVSNTSSEVAKIGKFLRAGAGAYIDPMRGYLYNTQAEEQSSAPQTARRLLAKSSNLSAQTASVNDGVGSIEVDFIDREVETEVETETVPEVEETTVISKVNPISGGVKAVNGWFDMRGRKLNAKPTTKGIYYFNGKQVFVR